MLYNAPRAATIIADTDAILYGLDRETFNFIVKESAINKRRKYEDFLNTVEVNFLIYYYILLYIKIFLINNYIILYKKYYI